MLRTEPMQKIRIVCLYNDKQEVTAALHRLGVVDLRKSKLDIAEDTHPAYFTELSDMAIKVEGAVNVLAKRQITPVDHVGVDELLKRTVAINKVLDEIYSLENERRILRDDQKLLDYGDYVSRVFSGVDVNLGSLHSAYLNFKAFETDNKTIKEFRKAIDEDKLDVDIITNPIDKKRELLFITYARGINVDNVIKKFKMTELDLNAKYLEGMPRNVRHTILEKKKGNEEKLSRITKQLDEISTKYYSKLVNLREMLEIEVARAEASNMFKRTEKSLVIEGWVPKKNLEQLESAVKEATHGKYHFDQIEPEDLAPTLVNRSKFMKPFEYLVDFFSVPRSDEIDPTWIFVVFFPLFYGLMISDAGYGIASIILATWITTRTDPDGLMYNVAKIWQYCSVSAIFFGFISNQYFGLQLNQYLIGSFGFHWINLISFNWITDIAAITVITVIFGLAQVTIGLVLSFINNYKKKNYKMATAKVTSITTLLFGTFAIAGGLFNVIPYVPTLICAGVAIVSVVITAILSGEESIEILSLIGHPLSYARIMGFGLASVIIALLIDKAFTPSLSQGIPIFLLYCVIFVALHLLNMILSIFEGIVQGVRLNFIEFFSKFYTGGGVKFKPFYYKRKYTQDQPVKDALGQGRHNAKKKV